MRRFSTRALALSLAVLVGLTPAASASVALGDELHSGTVGVAPGVQLTRQTFWGNSKSDLRTERYFTYAPGTGVYPVVAYGENVLSKQTLSAFAAGLEAQGHRVVGGVNGDFYVVSTGAPLGIVVTDGVLRSTTGGHYAVGFREDGSAFIGWPAVSVTATFSGYTLAVRDVNKIRTGTAGKPETGGYFLYTEDFGKTTQNTSPGVDVILTPITEGLGQTVDVDLDVARQSVTDGGDSSGLPADGAEPTDSQDVSPGDLPAGEQPETPDQVKGTLSKTDKLTIGGRVSCTVDQVLQSEGPIDIPAGKMVLSINSNSNEWLVTMAAQLQPGATVDIDVASTDTRWNDAVTAIGGFYRIVSNGKVGPDTDSAANPRTAIGVKADGSVVIYTIDGRQPGYSVGATLEQVGQRMIELGCVDAVGMDGGGSTTVGATLPWGENMEIVNQPSDGSLRAVSNALFLVSDLKPSGEADHLVVNPYDSVALSGAKIPLSAAAVDTNYYTMALPGAVEWSVDRGEGAVDGEGVFTAGDKTGTAVVTAQSGKLTGQSNVAVFDTPDSITLAREDTKAVVTSLALDPGETVDLTASAVYKKMALLSQDDNYVWTAEPTAGTVDENGLFTAADKSGTGDLTVTAGGRSVTIPVTIAGHIQELDSFETDAGLSALVGSDTVTVTAETASDLVRYGRRSAKLEYDAQSGAANVATALSVPAGDRFLSLWVYGDGSGNALTASVAGGDGTATDLVLTGLDFTGWKQLTVALPEGAGAILSLSVVYGGGEKAGGTLYLDQITTSNEDFVDDVPPTVTVEAAGGVLKASISDNVDKSFAAGAVTAELDGAPLSFQYDAAKNALSAALPADDGRLHRVTVTAVDQSGNIGRGSVNLFPAGLSDPEAAIPADPGPFTDMYTHWAGMYTTYLYNMGVTNGVEVDGQKLYQPEKYITRAEFSLMVARWMGLDLAAYSGVELPFADNGGIPAWSLDGIKAMYAQGIIKGSLDGGVLVCRANDTISRAEAMTILGRIQDKGYGQQELVFGDAGDVAAWALPYVESLVGQGIISGYENQLRPNDPVKRGEVAKMLFYML